MKLSIATASLLAAGAARLAVAQPAGDEVTSLPGWTDPFPSRQWSGFLNLSSGKRLHYHYVESERNPASDPLVGWLNGGPGCSSLIGFWTELGPWTMNGDGSLTVNPGRWNSFANVVYLESPAGVGFSYWPGAPQPYPANDTQTAADNMEALQLLIAAFPSLRGRDTYLAGEGGGG
jgi:cathepsin A (carboxypeptidase C)